MNNTLSSDLKWMWRATVSKDPAPRQLLHPGKLALSPEGRSWQVSYDPLLWIAPSVMACVPLLLLGGSWLDRLANAVTDNPVMNTVLVMVLILAVVGVVFAVVGTVIKRHPRGPLGPKVLWVPDELHDPVVQTIAHLRQMQPCLMRDALTRQLEATLRITKSATERTVDLDALDKLHEWAGAQIEKVDANAAYRAARNITTLTLPKED